MVSIKKFWRKLREAYNKKGLQFLLSISFTMISLTVMLVVTVGYNASFERTTEKMALDNNEVVLEQVNRNLDDYLHNMMSISNVIYYNIIKDMDIGKEEQAIITDKMRLIYAANQTYLVSISILSESGEIIAAQPFSRMKTGIRPSEEEWFQKAKQEIENIHFSTPHVENLFVDSDNIYHWVISLSRSVELIRNGRAEQGVLLVDMNITGIEKSCKDVNLSESGYCYIVDENGELIYHPKLQLIYGNVVRENHEVAATYADGNHLENFEGEDRAVTVKTMGYTGWKIIGVVPNSDITKIYQDSKGYFWIIALVAGAVLVFLNMFVSSKVTVPLKQLERSVRELEANNMEGDIPQNGTYEIRHLAKTLQSMAEKTRKLMKDIVAEQESKRKSEMDALQSQINPHFLYNALDSVIGMIEKRRYEGAVTMVTALAQLFRISLSRGKNIITVEKEMEHVENYLVIQKIRYRNKFEYDIEMEEEVKNCLTIKLIVQPLVENALYHGIEYMYGYGEIHIRAYLREDKVYMEVEDNGPGMTEEQVQKLMEGKLKGKEGNGSGIGFVNVQKRIKLCYGEEYGISVESEPDERTVMKICLPAIPMK